MNFGLRLFSAAARLFGPPRRFPAAPASIANRDIGDAGVAAAMVALGAKLAKADGVVTRDEIHAFRNVFQTTKTAQKQIARFFDLARQTTHGYQQYAKIVFRKYRARPDILEDVLDGLFHIALADGVISSEEMAFLDTVGKIFRFKPRTFARIRAAHIGRAADDPYLILGVDEEISDSALKKAYRAMAAANHPDRLAARGLPPELQKLATHKMAMINRAYQLILKERKNDLNSGDPA